MRRFGRGDIGRTEIAGAALELLDEGGLSALTMRALGQRLGIKAPSLYNHVGGLDDVIDLVQERVNAEIDTSSLASDDVAEAIGGVARSYRAAYLRHPWVLPHVVRRVMTSETTLRLYDSIAQYFARIGLPARDALVMMNLIDVVVIGSSLDSFQGAFDAGDTYADSHPDLARALSEGDRSRVEDDAFEAALRLYVAEVSARAAMAARPTSQARG